MIEWEGKTERPRCQPLPFFAFIYIMVSLQKLINIRNIYISKRVNNDERKITGKIGKDKKWNWHQELQSICPSSATYEGSGHGGSSLRRDTPAHLGKHRDVPKPAERWNLFSESRVCSQEHMSWIPQEASRRHPSQTIHNHDRHWMHPLLCLSFSVKEFHK